MSDSSKPAGGRIKTDVLTCAWLLGGHRWRLRARWDWKLQRRTIVGERCSRCDIERPLGGWFAQLRRDFALVSGAAGTNGGASDA